MIKNQTMKQPLKIIINNEVAIYINIKIKNTEK